MKQEKINGESKNTKKTSIWDIAIESIKSIKEFALHVVDSETLTPVGKANLIMIFFFGISILVRTIIQSFKDVDIPLIFYIFIGIGIISCMISSTSLTKIKASQLKKID